MSKSAPNVFKELFLQDKPTEMLVFLKQGGIPKYATQVAKGVDCTYSHTIKVLNAFQQLGLVEFKKKGRIKLIALTGDGVDIAHDVEGLARKFSKMNKEKKIDIEKLLPKKAKK
ncbi:MAG: hypothetical protein HYS81_04135 [Candidatus Aenigmatarchaeota archaeon]|nr:MAG: hypothetical protein HYS81_04135 [Candidatus Aenigmarchaeota archaeon]